jgi:DNA-binding NarL/FixJ family response regulator
MPIRVLLVDDHAIFRRGLRSLLADEKDLAVHGEAEGGSAALAAVAKDPPDVVTLDIRLGDIDGIQVAHRLSRSHPKVRTIILSTYEDRQYLLGALQAGAYAYLLKSSSFDILPQAIRTVHSGQRLLAPELISHVLEDYQRISKQQTRRDLGLSTQEVEVLRLLAEGERSQEIATRLSLSEITVKRKVQEITTKLNARNRTQAVAEAIRRGLV